MALLVDKAGSHFNFRDIREQVSVIPLPANVTAVHQHGHGRNFNLEADVPAVFGSQMVQDLESRAERRELNRGRTYGLNGLAEGYDPHMLDAANLGKLSWDNVSRMTIARVG